MEKASAQVSLEPDLDEGDTMSSDLTIISVSSGVPSPRDPLVTSKLQFRKQIAEDLLYYDELRRIHQRVFSL